jgi:HEAT repeat protein
MGEGETPALMELRKSILDGPYGKKVIYELVDDLIETEGSQLEEVYLALSLRKQEAVRIVLEKLETGTPAAKRKVTKLLRYGRWPEAVPKLLEVVSSDNEHEISRTGALYALGAIGDRSAGPTIAELLDKPNRSPTEKRIMIATLARLNYRTAIPKIKEYLTHENLLVRIFSARALAELGQTVDAAILFDALQNEDYVVRQEACGALGSVGGPNVISKLEDVSQNDPHSSVRSAARIALNRSKTSRLPEAEKSRLIKGLVSDPDKNVRSWAIETLDRECGENGKKSLREMASQQTSEGRKAAIHLLMTAGTSNHTSGEVEP